MTRHLVLLAALVCGLSSLATSLRPPGPPWSGAPAGTSGSQQATMRRLHAELNRQALQGRRAGRRQGAVQDYIKGPRECRASPNWPHRSDGERRRRKQRVGGAAHTSYPGLFPSQVTIRFTMLGSGEESFCGGTLLTSNIVLTAAHCVMQGQDFLVSEQLLGPYAWEREAVKPVRARHACFSPQFKFEVPGGNDFGIVILEQPIELGDTVSTACLSNWPMPKGDVLYLAGAGATRAREMDENFQSVFPDLLQYGAQVETECAQWDKSPINFCTTAKNQTHPTVNCAGDSGGGLYGVKDNYKVLYGVLSRFGAQCSTDMGGYSVYSAVYPNSQKIKNLAFECLSVGVSKARNAPKVAQ